MGSCGISGNRHLNNTRPPNWNKLPLLNWISFPSGARSLSTCGVEFGCCTFSCSRGWNVLFIQRTRQDKIKAIVKRFSATTSTAMLMNLCFLTAKVGCRLDCSTYSMFCWRPEFTDCILSADIMLRWWFWNFAKRKRNSTLLWYHGSGSWSGFCLRWIFRMELSGGVVNRVWNGTGNRKQLLYCRWHSCAGCH